MRWKCPQIWDGGDVFILGGGPSLAQVDASRLVGQKAIAVNTAFKYFPQSPVMYFMDCHWLDRNWQELRKFRGLRVSSCPKTKELAWILFLDHNYATRYGLDDRPGFIARANNSGCGAVALGHKLGAKRAILLGFDMRVVDGQHNFHTEHTRKVAESLYRTQFMKGFEKLKVAADAAGYDILNATPDSALECFPQISLDEVLP